MPHRDRHASSSDFSQACRDAFARCSFTAPAKAEACVLLCDSTSWTSLAVSAESLLDAAERARAARFHFEHDRLTYVTAHALWRVALGVCLGLDATDVHLVCTVTGQPRLPGTGYATSLSHTGTWIAVAICAGATVGVDIERSPSRLALEGLLPLMCTPAEITGMNRLSTPARDTALLMLWTRKEALLKAFGVGLSEDPAQLSATHGDLVMPPATVTDQVPCRVRDVQPMPSGLVGALALPDGATTTRLHRLDNTPVF